MSNKSTRRAKQIQEIQRLKHRRRIDILKCVIALGAVLLLVGGKQMLAALGIDVYGSMAFGGFEMIATIALAILGGTASIDYTKAGIQIGDIKRIGGITDDHIQAFEREQRVGV